MNGRGDYPPLLLGERAWCYDSLIIQDVVGSKVAWSPTMSDWDAPSGDEKPRAATAAVTKNANWDGEDEEKGVASDWEQSSESDGEKKAHPQGSAPPQKKKGSLKTKLAEKEAERKRRLEKGEPETEYMDMREKFMDEKEMRRIMREKELEADMKNASDLFGATTIQTSTSSKTKAPSVNPTPAAAAEPQIPAHLAPFLSLPAKISSKADFDALSRLIYANLIKPHVASGQYAAFVESHAKELCATFNEGQTRKVANALSGLAATKLAATRGASKKKPGGKGMLAGEGGGKGKHDTTAYDESLDDFGGDPDDFM